jgi:DNA polymerase-1
MTTLVFDLEADGFLDTVSKIHCLTIAHQDGEEWAYQHYTDASSEYPSLNEGYERLSRADRLVAHNGITYDLPVLAKVADVDILAERMVDTLVLSRLAKPERAGGHSLGAWGEVLGVPKVEHDEWEKWSPEMRIRCDEDVRINVMVYEKLKSMLEAMPEAVNIEHATALSIHKMCQSGVHFDEDAAVALLQQLMTEVEHLGDKLQTHMPYVYKPKSKPKALKQNARKNHWGFGSLEADVPFTEVKHVQLQISSRQDMVRYLKQRYNWTPTEKTKTGQAKLNDEVLRSLPWDGTEEMADYFKTVKIIGFLNAEINKNGKGGGWLHHVKKGKLHAGFIPLTAVTGRPSCAAPNLQQVPTDRRVRALFGPRRGWKLVGVDADGQELRCLGHYLARYDNGSYGKEVVQGDIHTRIQKLIGFNTRNGTKPVEYALLYGAGDPKLGLLALKDAMAVGKTIPAEDLDKAGRAVRRKIMNGLTGYKELSTAVKNKAKTSGRLRGMDGRTLWVRSAHSALNLVLQSAGIILMKKALSLLDSRLKDVGLTRGVDYELMLWVHDEFQFECKPEVAELLGKTAAAVIEEAGQLLGFRVPMTGTYQVGANWSETH